MYRGHNRFKESKPILCKVYYSALSNYIKFVHWCLMGSLLLQRGRNKPHDREIRLRCTECKTIYQQTVQ